MSRFDKPVMGFEMQEKGEIFTIVRTPRVPAPSRRDRETAMGTMMERSYVGAAPFSVARFAMPAGRTVLVVIDMQNEFLHPNGWYAKQGIAIDHMRAAIQPTATLVREARVRGVPVIWTRHGFRDLRDAGIFGELRPFFKDGGLRRGSWGCEILEECGPLATD